MLTLRFAAACAAGAGVFWCGLRRSRRISARPETAEALAASAGRMRSAIMHRHALKRELLAELPFPCGGDEAALLEYLDGADFPFGEKEAEKLRAFISALGEGTLERQLALTDDFRDFWKDAAENAKREKAEKGRLCLSLGGLGGLAAIIILA
ncbi:MAG: hypothetical protein J5441_04530 [Clostridia bacterium]|nr:hypothetical protein [Clostridia bacterium]